MEVASKKNWQHCIINRDNTNHLLGLSSINLRQKEEKSDATYWLLEEARSCYQDQNQTPKSLEKLRPKDPPKLKSTSTGVTKKNNQTNTLSEVEETDKAPVMPSNN